MTALTTPAHVQTRGNDCTGLTARWCPNQLMPEHFGGESALSQSRDAQHAKAAYLWNGGVNTRSGLGPQNWKACL